MTTKQEAAKVLREILTLVTVVEASPVHLDSEGEKPFVFWGHQNKRELAAIIWHSYFLEGKQALPRVLHEILTDGVARLRTQYLDYFREVQALYVVAIDQPQNTMRTQDHRDSIRALLRLMEVTLYDIDKDMHFYILGVDPPLYFLEDVMLPQEKTQALNLLAADFPNFWDVVPN